MDAEANAAIREYLDSVSRHLSALPEAPRAEMLRDIMSHIYDALADRTQGREATLEDVRFVLAEMDPPESYAQACPDTERCEPIRADRLNRGGRVPRVLMFGLSALGVIVAILFVRGLLSGDLMLLINAVGSCVLLVGLRIGNKAAYVITIVAVVGGVIWDAATKGLGFGVAGLVVNSLVLVPVLLSTSYFFPKRNAGLKRARPA